LAISFSDPRLPFNTSLAELQNKTLSLFSSDPSINSYMPGEPVIRFCHDTPATRQLTPYGPGHLNSSVCPFGVLNPVHIVAQRYCHVCLLAQHLYEHIEIEPVSALL